MKLSQLLGVLPEFKNAPKSSSFSDLEASDLCVDTRKASAGCVFVAIRGHQFDTHSHLSEIAALGASAIIAEDLSQLPANYSGFVLKVESTRQALDLLAVQWAGEPSRKLLCFGVTGTNGKTSSTYMMEHLLSSARIACGVIGTVDHHLGEKIWTTESTTPGPIELQKRLQEMWELGAKAMAMEVSSHALDQHRADSVHFNVVMFTNLTRDHLDYHHDMEKYFAAKQRLFSDLMWTTEKSPAFAIVNTDDDWGRKLKMPADLGLWTYGTGKNSDWRFEILDQGYVMTKFRLYSPFGNLEGHLPLGGVHNVYNAVGVVAAAAVLGLPPGFCLQQLAHFKGVPGRLQPVPNSRGLNVLVDYAHSPDALENVLSSLASIREKNKKGRIITVFGCGGDRDRGKRPLMAAVAEKYSDRVIVTSDNPRTEEPQLIISEILPGFIKLQPEVICDRKEAIGRALQICEADDVVLIAGKGHEQYQIVGTEKLFFSDVLIASEILEGVSRRG